MRTLPALIWLVGCGGTASTVTPQSRDSVTVATYDLYPGADLMTLFGTTGNPAPAVAQLFRAVGDSRPNERMDAIAGELADAAPDLIALEEVSLWRTQMPADGTATPAREVAFDFLQRILDGLERRGQRYRAVAVGTNADVEVTGDFGGGAMMDVRLTDRDVILARADFLVTKTERDTFATRLVVSGVDVVRGWVAVETPGFRFMATHLEAAQDQIRDAQAAQLLADSADPSSLILAGDFNFAPGSAPYDTFTAARLEDVAGAGPTCCQDADLRNPSSKLGDRVDLVWQRGKLSSSGATLLGPEQTASGVWASDHAGVKVTLTR